MPEGVPTRTVWPRSLSDPATWESVDAFATAMRAVYEAAHAVIAAQLGLTVVRVWVGDADELGPDDPVTATALTEYLGQPRGDDAFIIALAAWPAALHQLRLLGLDNDGNVAGMGAGTFADKTSVLFGHGIDHDDCPDVLNSTVGDCDHVARLADTAVMMAHQCFGQIMTVANRLAEAGGRLVCPDIPIAPHLPTLNRATIQPLHSRLRWGSPCMCRPPN